MIVCDTWAQPCPGPPPRFFSSRCSVALVSNSWYSSLPVFSHLRALSFPGSQLSRALPTGCALFRKKPWVHPYVVIPRLILLGRRARPPQLQRRQAIPFISPAYEHQPGMSLVSPTYAKTGECTPTQKCRRADIFDFSPDISPFLAQSVREGTCSERGAKGRWPLVLLFYGAARFPAPSLPALRKFVSKGSSPVSTTTAPTRAAKRAFNFNAGPAALPLPVLERIREELLDYRGTGMSVMEMSHRSPEFEAINNAAEQNLRKLLAIPDDYAVIFVQGGGSMQFTMVPMNLALAGKPVDVLHTGAWTAKAISELKKGILHHIAASTESEKFARLPRRDEMKFSPDASYVHICTNNTIEGTQWTSLPETGHVPLVADMSSDIASRPIDVKRYGAIFAGAQKNLGPPGVTVVIIRKDLSERADKNLPTLLQYRTHIKEKSLYHTPPTFAVYIVGLVLE